MICPECQEDLKAKHLGDDILVCESCKFSQHIDGWLAEEWKQREAELKLKSEENRDEKIIHSTKSS